MKIEELDSNFKQEELENSLNYTEVRNTAAVIEGLCPGTWQRLPDAVLEEVGRPELTELAHHTSGGAIRFRTDAEVLRFRMELLQPDFMMSHMPLTGSAGMDVFADGNYVVTLRTELGRSFVEGEVDLKNDVHLSGKVNVAEKVNEEGETHSEQGTEITIYLPLYNGVKAFYIAMPQGGKIMPPSAHKHREPIIFYGSSITQGGCASRTSNAYTNLVARWMDAQIYCLGFSGNARGDMAVAEYLIKYIAEHQTSCLIYDYDYNAPNAEALGRTHEPFLRKILEKHPQLPVLLMSRPNPEHSPEESECEARRKIVQETAEKFEREGYRVMFLDGRALFGEESRECCTVDGIHPNDLGFYRMAKKVEQALGRLLGETEMKENFRGL